MYDDYERRLPSVSDILYATKTKEAKDALKEWKARVGIEEANRIVERSTRIGKAVHGILEAVYSGNEPLEDHLHAIDIACSMYDRIEALNTKVISCETPLHNEMACGITDLICLTGDDQVLTIMDFKTAEKLKRKDWIEDYIIQCAAYADMLADMTGEVIDRLIIVMASYDCQTVEYVIEGDELEEYLGKWYDRVEAYYA